jgi:hypothetical protein
VNLTVYGKPDYLAFFLVGSGLYGLESPPNGASGAILGVSGGGVDELFPPQPDIANGLKATRTIEASLVKVMMRVLLRS